MQIKFKTLTNPSRPTTLHCPFGSKKRANEPLKKNATEFCGSKAVTLNFLDGMVWMDGNGCKGAMCVDPALQIVGRAIQIAWRWKIITCPRSVKFKNRNRLSATWKTLCSAGGSERLINCTLPFNLKFNAVPAALAKCTAKDYVFFSPSLFWVSRGIPFYKKVKSCSDPFFKN